MKHAIASFKLDLVFDSRRLDPELNLVVAWYDPASGMHQYYCDYFISDPRSAKKLAKYANAPGAFDRSELWSVEADISYDPEHIDIRTVRLDVLEFDQKSGSMLETPVNVQISVRSQSIIPKVAKKPGKTGRLTMDQILRDLLEALEAVQEKHPEITDTEVREAMSDAVWHLFIVPKVGFKMPKSFFLDSAKANRAVHKALKDYIGKAKKVSQESGVLSFRDRLAAFQNSHVGSPGGYSYDDFFGWTDPDQYEASGAPKR